MPTNKDKENSKLIDKNDNNPYSRFFFAENDWKIEVKF